MRRRSITRRVLTFNLLIVLVLAAVTAMVFGFVARVYMEQDVMEQLGRIAQKAELTALRPPGRAPFLPGLPPEFERLGYYFELDRVLRETLTVLNADYVLLDAEANQVAVVPRDLMAADPNLRAAIAAGIELPQGSQPKFGTVEVEGQRYAVVIKQLTDTNPLDVRWLLVYSSLEKLTEMESATNRILLVILLGAVLLCMLLSALLVKRITAPFAFLTKHIQAIAQRDFGRKVDFPVDAELEELVQSINTMSEKLESHDQAQKTFLQNVSHEFRTPLMAIGSYAEGVVHKVVDPEAAAGIIIDETKRLTRMVEDLLYLSRLNSIEEIYDFNTISLSNILRDAATVAQGLAAAENKELLVNLPKGEIRITADGDKLIRAIVNVLDNCLRYAKTRVMLDCQPNGDEIRIAIADDGPGIPQKDLPHVFKRFFKGAAGQVGLGLAIAASIVERHGGTITAENSNQGAVFTICFSRMSH